MQGSAELNRLLVDVEDLLAQLEAVEGSDIQALKDRVEAAVQETRETLLRRAGRAVRRVTGYARSFDDYVTGFPRLGFLTGMLVGGVAVYLATLVADDD